MNSFFDNKDHNHHEIKKCDEQKESRINQLTDTSNIYGSKLLWSSIKYRPDVSFCSVAKCDVLIIRVFQGGSESVQFRSFETATELLFDSKLSSKDDVLVHNNCRLKVRYEYCTTTMLSDRRIFGSKANTFQALVEWLLASHIHIILSHIHQGIHNFYSWNTNNMLTELEKLYYHDGFPTREQLYDPVFTQDKFEYISALGSLANTSLKVILVKGGNYDQELTAAISRSKYTNYKNYLSIVILLYTIYLKVF